MSHSTSEEAQINSNIDEFWGKCLIVVSGASRGLGAAICNGLASVLAPGSTIVGLARTKDGLIKTEESVKKINPNIKFNICVMDLLSSSLEDITKILHSNLDAESDVKYNRAIIFHNAGSLGDLSYLKSIHCFQSTNDYFRLNISSVVVLNSWFLELCAKTIDVQHINVVNVSSLCAVAPMKSWGLYCSGKAARDMLFKVLAMEEENITVVNYAPGPLDNDMQVSARTSTGDPELRALFSSLHAEGKLVKESDSVEKLFKILCDSKYKSGDHVDYYDDN